MTVEKEVRRARVCVSLHGLVCRRTKEGMSSSVACESSDVARWLLRMDFGVRLEWKRKGKRYRELQGLREQSEDEGSKAWSWSAELLYICRLGAISSNKIELGTFLPPTFPPQKKVTRFGSVPHILAIPAAGLGR